MRQILVVDDDLAAYQAIQDRLQNDITEVSCISSPVEALASYIQQDYCLVILDTQLSNRDTAEMIRAMRSSKHTPILVLTNPLHPEKIVELLNAGADSYLEKPLNTDICVQG